MPTVLPPARTELSNTPSQSNAVAKAGLGKMWDWLTNLVGTTGTIAGALTTLGAVAKAGDSWTGAQNEARATVASAATTADIWAAAGNSINWTGTATTTTFPAAPQAGAKRRLHCAGLCSFTHSATLDIIGNANFTAVVGDIVEVEAITTTTFRLIPIKDNGTAIVVASTLPSQTGNSGKALVTNGTVESWGYPAQLSTASGSAPSYAARAFCNFNGTGTPAINASGNMSSLTDNGPGDWSLNLTTALPDAFGTVEALGSVLASGVPTAQTGTAGYMVNSSSARVAYFNSNSGVLIDAAAVNVTIHR